MIDKLNKHYSFTTPIVSRYDEESLTVLEQSGRQGAKINEIIDAQNKVTKDTKDAIDNIQNVLVPNTVKSEVDKQIKNGTFDASINAYARDLQGRVDNLAKLQEGSTTGDAELIDARVDYNGTTWGNVGSNIRKTTKKLNDEITQMLTEELEVIEFTTLGGWFQLPYKAWVTTEHQHLKQNVEADECYYVACTYGWEMPGVIFFNENDEYLSHLLINESGMKTETYDNPILVPYGAKTMVVQCFENGTQKLGIRKVVNRRPTFDDVYMKNIIESVTPKSPSLMDVESTLHTTSVLQNGIVTSSESGFANWHVREYDVERGQRYKIKGSNQYSNAYYEIYDNVGNMLAQEYSEYTSTLHSFEMDVVIPNKGVKLFVIGNNTKQIASAQKYVGSNAINSLSHLKWVCMGDSLTELNTRASKRYFDYVQDKTGIQVVNMGVSGSGYKKLDGENKAFYQRSLNIPSDADVVTIFGSGNDLSLTMGNPTDTGTTTICGCINKTIDNILSVNPTVQIGIVAPTPWSGNTPTDNGTMATYCENLKTIALRRGIPYLDLFHESGLRPNDATFRTLAYSKDDGNGVHPDETGHKMISGRFYTFIQTLVGTY